MRVLVKSYNPNDPDRMLHKVKVLGYTKFGISKLDMVTWVEWFVGRPGFYFLKPIAFEFYGKILGAAFSFFTDWLREKNPDLAIKHSMENPHLCYHCVHMPYETCPVEPTEIPMVEENEVKQCDMFFHEDNCEGG